MPSRTNIIGIFFIALFGALLAVFAYAANADWSIHDWNGIISWATAENLDVDRRIGSFYRSFGVFFIVFISILRILNKWIRKIFAESELSMLNYLSLAGCMLLFFKLTGAVLRPSFELIFVLQLLIIIYALADYFLSGRRRTQTLSVHQLAWCGAIGMSVIFFIPKDAYFSTVLFLLCAGGLHFCFWLPRKGKTYILHRWIVSGRYIALAPLLFVLSQELYMILNQHEVYAVSPYLIFIVLLAVIAVFIFRSRQENENNEAAPQAVKAIGSFYFPWLLVGLMALAYYKPIAETSTEMFEQANPALSIQQFFEFGKLPWLQTFSSHSGADWMTGFLYSFLNGFTGLSYHCYDFLVVVLYVLLMYYTIRNLTNPYIAIISVLFFPYVNLLLPQYHFIMLLPLLILASALKTPTFKNYFLLFSCLVLMPLWRYDLALGNIISMAGSLAIFLYLNKGFRTSFPAMRKGFLFALIAPAILFIAALILTHQSLVITMKDAVAYLGTPQAFGRKDLANETTLVYYALYFIFPVAVGICFFYALWKLWLARNEKPAFSMVAVLFLSIYYVINFHRGLIRHNLSEGWDTAFTSFAFLIFAITVYDFLRTKNRTLQLAATLAFVTLLLAEFKYPKPDFNKSNYYSEAHVALSAPFGFTAANEKINRGSLSASDAKALYLDLKVFLDKNIPADATFLDFSNTPMLYFYTHRQTPNYFNQIPHTALNHYLQERFLEELKDYKVPVVVFSNSPRQWWDDFDGIPNTYRHYLIAEYIYKHYQPYAILNKHTVWLEKGHRLLTDSTPSYIKDTVSYLPKAQELKLLPYIMGKSSATIWGDTLTLYKEMGTRPDTIEAGNGIGTGGNEELNEADYITFNVQNLSGKRFRMNFGYGPADKYGFSFDVPEDSGTHPYIIRLSTDFNWVNRSQMNYSFHAESKCVVSDMKLMKGKP